MACEEDVRDLVTSWQEAIADVEDPLRRLADLMLRRQLAEEMCEFLRAAPYEGTEGRRGYRNGHTP
jgi:transposase-like protein